ncbi:hypothetical protein IE077_002127 [Cardiosporidium cionae]|uniref:Uncharacterized protein n=1 Tax=Cardiosporidium cionae TaxID=476202 RepID=A0ABQ7JBH8_9APIC|nr:hypothetical protein IE077_002127 [Cardiosporidium cionae]|eukprot:KAF8821349.1 hypothetical protein IE077_002127 [Cardiosporidium cionae]
MQVFRKATLSAAGKGLPLRQAWHNLSAFTQTLTDANEWRALRNRDLVVQTVIDRYDPKRVAFTEVQWKKWEDSISHQPIVKCLKNFYEHQLALIDSVLKEDHRQIVHSQIKGWTLFEEAVKSCEKSVEKSEALVANGARALWVSYNNPPLWKIDTNEWVETDLYWQAYIEKHHFYNPNPTSDDPELPNEIEANKKTWHTKLNKFSDRSDTPLLYSYMEQLPSWEYYDIHRRAFLEHMAYFLIRTGEDFRFFPECPPWQWLTEIEDLRYRFLSVTQRRRAHFQLESEERQRALEVQPLDYAHHGEEFHLKWLQSETRSYEFLVGRLMGNFMFLTHPYIPIQTKMALQRAMLLDHGSGKLFSVGNDVNALFYLPSTWETHITTPLPSPRQAFTALLDHLALSGKRMQPGYATLMDIHTELLEKRGSSWFTIPGESLADAFLRRLRIDDPSYFVYEVYITELKERFSNATEINFLASSSEVHAQLMEIETHHKEEEMVYEKIIQTLNPEISIESKEEMERLIQLHHAEQLQPLLSGGSLVAIHGESQKRVEDAGVLLQQLSKEEDEQGWMMDYMKSIKVGPSLEKMMASKR